MAARVPGDPGDPAAAALDELARNFTYGGPAAANGSLSRAWYRSHQGHLFGVLLAILGHVVISISLNIQKISYVQLAQESRPHFRNALWWVGTTFLALGEVGNFAAYGLAPITLIAPLGCVSVSGSAIISVIFLRENLRASDLLGITLAFAGTYLLVNFAPCAPQTVTARTIQYYFVGWKFMVYVILEILVFCILLYFHKRKGLKHMAILLSLVSLLASLTVIAARAVSGMLTASVADPTQLTYPIFYIMLIIMIASCICQVKHCHREGKGGWERREAASPTLYAEVIAQRWLVPQSSHSSVQHGCCGTCEPRLLHHQRHHGRNHILSRIPRCNISHCIYLPFWMSPVIPWCGFGHKDPRKGTASPALHRLWKYSWETETGHGTARHQWCSLWPTA